jgi:hypothetical protein
MLTVTETDGFLIGENIAFSRRRKRDNTMPEYVQEQTKPTNGNSQQEQQPCPIQVQPDGTWILGRGADRWIPSENQIRDLRWVVERDLRRELGVPPKTALNKDKIEFHKRQLALLDLAKQAPRCEHVFTDGRCCKAPRVKKGKLCYAHTLMEEKRPLELNLPPLEDANAVMLWLMDVLRGLAEGRTTEKTAGIMLYGLQLAMVNARFTTFQDTKHAEMVRKAPGDRRNRRNRSSSPTSEGRATPIFIAKDAKVAKNEEHQGFTAEAAENAEEEICKQDPSSRSSGAKNQPLRAQRSTEEEPAGDFTAEIAEVAKEEKPEVGAALRVENSLEPRNAEVESQEKGTASRIEERSEPQNAAVNPGVESAKSIFFGVEAGEGVAGNRPVMPPPEPPRKSSQSEVLVVPKDVERHAGG